MPDLDSCIPFPIDEATLNDVVQKAKDWALMHGAAMRSKANFSEDSLQVIDKTRCTFFFFSFVIVGLHTSTHSFFYYILVCAIHFIANSISTS